MGRDCKYCGAYISDAYDVCPACGKKVKPEHSTEAEPYVNRTYGAQQAETDRREGAAWKTNYRTGPSQAADYTNYRKPGETGDRDDSYSYTYTYKDEYKRRYGQTADGANRERSSKKEAVDADTDTDAANNKLFGCLAYFGPLFLVSYFLRRDSEFVKFHCNQGLALLAINLLLEAAALVPVVGWMIKSIAKVYVMIGFISGVVNALGGKKKPLPGLSDIKILK